MWLSWLSVVLYAEGLPGSIPGFVGWIPGLGLMGGNQSLFLSHMDASLSPSPYMLSKINF